MSESSTTLPATTRRGVQVKVVIAPRKTLPGVLVDARQVNRLPVLTAYRLPVSVRRPPFQVMGDTRPTK